MQKNKQEHFIKNIEIKNFKCFENFKAEGFGRVNLIGGKNNVGKTAFMEAVCINVYSTNISLMTNVLSSPKLAREFLEIGYRVLLQDERKDFLESIKNYSSTSNINNIEFKIIEDSGIKEYFFHFDNKSMKININDFSYEKTKKNNIKFLTQLGFTKYQLKQVFESVQKKDVENILYEYINNFDNNILNFKIIGGDKPQCKINTGEYRDINEFGDGLKHWISIICSLYACENGYLFIDELDNGIHYTQLDKLWEIILTISKEQNVQVFATTHSKECIESYARVAKRLEDEEITMIMLARNLKNELKALVYDDKMFYSELEQNHEVRGW
jgi:AAA15 family ATPase/GTPase